MDQGVSGISGSRDAVRQAVVRTSHTYNPALADEITHLIATQYGKELQGLQQELRRRAEQSR